MRVIGGPLKFFRAAHGRRKGALRSSAPKSWQTKFVVATRIAFSESARRPSVVPLRVSVVGVAIRAPVVATTAPLGLGIIATAPLGLTTIVTVGVFPTVAGFRIPRDLILAARGHARQHNLGVLQANLLHQREKRCGILG